MADPVAHIKRLIANDISLREDNLARARMQFTNSAMAKDGLMTAEEVADYEDDVKVGRETETYFAKLVAGKL